MTTTSTPRCARRSWDTPFTATVLALATLAVFWPLLNFQFINYDDPDFVINNPHVQDGLSARSISWAFTSLWVYWQPLTWISYMADYQFWGLNPRGFHLTSLLLHVANTVLLFLVLKRMTQAHWPSAIVAALFSLHPFHVETVAWIAERKGVLSSLFWILALGAYTLYAERPRWTRYVLVLFLYALGLMAKPMVITLPFVLLLLDFWPLNRLRLPWRNGAEDPLAGGGMMVSCPERTLVQLLIEKLPMLVLAAGSSVLTLAAQNKAVAILSLEQFSLWQRIGHALLTYCIYLIKTVWPSGLTVFYPLPTSWPMVAVVLAGSALLIATAALCRLARRFPYLLVGWLWFLGTLVPVIGLFQVGDQAFADRYAYLPLIGLFLMAAWGGAELLSGQLHCRTVAALSTLLVLAACLIRTGVQLQSWRNTQTVFEQARAVTSHNYVAAAVLANVHAESGALDEAEILYREALTWKPDFVDGHLGIGNVLVKKGKYEEAILHYRYAIKRNPSSSEGHSAIGVALFRKKQPEEAIAHLSEAVRLNPLSPETHLALALALQSQGRAAQARAEFGQVLTLEPTSTVALLNLGNGLIEERRFVEALTYYRQALQLQPNAVEALNRAAWILATHEDAAVRDGPEAIRLATQACELTRYEDPLSLNTLAAACAETGAFERGVELVQKAIRLATAAGRSQLLPIFENLLGSYQAAKPYRDASN